MPTLISAIFFASILGSLHCAGMCGAFLAIAVGDSGSWRRHVALQSAYHGGRLVSYTILGLAAGTVGHFVDLGGALAGLSRVATAVAGATIVVFAIVTLLQVTGVSRARLHPPEWMSAWVHAGHRVAMARPPVVRAGMIGLFTTLLPCGWLYAFVAASAGTASPWLGALTMSVFWLGTLPVMVGAGAGIKTILGPLGRRMPVVTCVALICIGTWTLLGRTGLDAVVLAAHVHGPTTQGVVDKPECCKERADP